MRARTHTRRPALILTALLWGALPAGCSALLDFDDDYLQVSVVGGGGTFTCGQLEDDGPLYCWGGNDWGQAGAGLVGDPYQTLDEVTPVITIGAVRAFDLGQTHACAADVSSQLWCWGDNTSQQLGSDAVTRSAEPLKVPNATGIDAVAAGEAFTCVRAGGEVHCFGDNTFFQLTDAVTGGVENTPTMIELPTEARYVGAGKRHVCVIDIDTEIWCWGDNSSGQAGADSAGGVWCEGVQGGCVAQPAQVALDGTIELGVGGAHNCAITGSGELWCWGKNSTGQCGSTTYAGPANQPRMLDPVEGVSGWTAVTAGRQHTCGISTQGVVWCWGLNDRNQIGNGVVEVDFYDVPQPVDLPRGAQSLAAGADHTCAVLVDRSLWCWGSNHGGQLLADGQIVATPRRLGRQR